MSLNAGHQREGRRNACTCEIVTLAQPPGNGPPTLLTSTERRPSLMTASTSAAAPAVSLRRHDRQNIRTGTIQLSCGCFVLSGSTRTERYARAPSTNARAAPTDPGARTRDTTTCREPGSSLTQRQPKTKNTITQRWPCLHSATWERLPRDLPSVPMRPSAAVGHLLQSLASGCVIRTGRHAD